MPSFAYYDPMKPYEKTITVKCLGAVSLFVICLLISPKSHALRILKNEKTVFQYPKHGRLQIDPKIEKVYQKMGGYEIFFSKDGLYIRKENSDTPAFASAKGVPFLVGGIKNPNISTNIFGSVFIAQRFRERFCAHQSVDSIEKKGQEIILKGALYGEKCRIPYEAKIYQEKKGYINIEARNLNESSAPTWLALSTYRDQEELFYGGGEQFTELVLNGFQIPFLIQEQGHGRSRWETSLPLDILSKGLSGGDRFTTYIPIASTFTSDWRGLKLLGTSYSLLDLKRDHLATFWSFSDILKMEIFSEGDPLSAVKKVSESAGLPHKVPEWFYEGAMLGGFIGGEEPLAKIMNIIDTYKIHTKTMWIEDWCGVQPVGQNSKRLKWNWEVDRSLYPNWDKIVANLKKRGIRIGGYLNPLTRLLSKDHYRYEEFNMPFLLRDQGHLIQRKDNSYATTDLGRIDAYFVDLFDPAAYSYLKDIVREKMLGAGLQFWNADFGESLPIYNQYTTGKAEALSIRHDYIEKWAQFNHELIHEDLKGDGVAFIRSGHTGTLGYNQMYWQGDQLTTYDEHDGLFSTTIANITGGLSGILINHSDVGGAVKYLNIKRNHRMMKRWMEKETFGPLLRSKEGLGTLKLSVIDDPELTKAFAKWADVFHGLLPYRKKLYHEAYAGLPIIRAMFLHYPEDRNVYELKDQFLFGEDMVVAPVHDKSDERTVYLPRGSWTHFMSGQMIEMNSGKRVKVRAPLGCPAVFFKSSNSDLSMASQNLRPEYRKACQ